MSNKNCKPNDRTFNKEKPKCQTKQLAAVWNFESRGIGEVPSNVEQTCFVDDAVTTLLHLD
jgi:hypothetical protein